ncbi:MAG: aldo/keto reductase [Planctomycetes bacterium]|nr:aldo/keto reductase [Planctomycetota bacterium]
MDYRPLGRSGLKVSALSLGSWLTYGGSVDETDAAGIIARAFDLGINMFDTADVYSGGRAEEALGRALRSLPREQIVVATKARARTWNGPLGAGLSRKHLTDSLDKSLRRLGVDYVDLYQLHAPDAETPLEETISTLHDFVRCGKVLYLGLSNFDTEQTRDALEICDRRGFERFVSSQPPYSLLRRDIEGTLMERCRREGLGLVVYSPLAQGVLTGKYKTAAARPKGTRAALHPDWMRHALTADNLARVRRLAAVAKKNRITLAQLSLAWVLRRPEVSSAIIGASSVAQLEENVKAAKVRLSAADLKAIETAVA